MLTKEQIELVSPDEIDSGIVRETVIEVIAAACHQQNRMYCGLLMDHSQALWLEAEDWQRNSAIIGVKNALLDPDPSASHRSWLDHKRAEGWTYGEVKDAEKKTHPCMVPYGDLPDAQKRKDAFFVSMVQQLGLVAGLIRKKG